MLNKTSKTKPKIFCLILTQESNHLNKAIHVRNTWAKRCDQHIFLSSANDTSLPAIKVCRSKDSRDHLWCKTKSGFQFVYDNYIKDFEWFLKADDDSYIIVENLRSFVSNYSYESPLYFGQNFRSDNVTYMSGGAGYVLSREAVRRFATKSRDNTTDPKLCDTSDSGVEDFNMGECLQNFGVIAGDSRDESQKPRFFMLEAWKIFPSKPEDLWSSFAPWFHNYSVYPHKSGAECCSPTLISFHYVPSDIMHLIDFMLYNVKVVQ